jgi:hypothetical protein
MKCETCDSEFDEAQVKVWVGKTVCQSCFAILNRGRQADQPSTVGADPPQPTASHEQPFVTPNEDRHLPSRRLQSQAGVPDWRYTAGPIALTIGGLAFVASAVVGGQGDFAAGILSGLLNPLFFVSVPLGLYWLRQARFTAEAVRGPHKGSPRTIPRPRFHSLPESDLPRAAGYETELGRRLRYEAHRRRTEQRKRIIFIVAVIAALIWFVIVMES